MASGETLSKAADETSRNVSSDWTPPYDSFPFAGRSAKLSNYMKMLRKWWKPALTIVALFVIVQIGVSLLVRTHRMRAYL